MSEQNEAEVLTSKVFWVVYLGAMLFMLSVILFVL